MVSDISEIAARREWPVDVHPLPPLLHNHPARIPPAVAAKLSLTDLDACFDEATFLRHVHEVIARLDRLVPAAAASEVANADG